MQSHNAQSYFNLFPVKHPKLYVQQTKGTPFKFWMMSDYRKKYHILLMSDEKKMRLIMAQILSPGKVLVKFRFLYTYKMDFGMFGGATF